VVNHVVSKRLTIKALTEALKVWKRSQPIKRASTMKRWNIGGSTMLPRGYEGLTQRSANLAKCAGNLAIPNLKYVEELRNARKSMAFDTAFSGKR
jgi:hypothetical protein